MPDLSIHEGILGTEIPRLVVQGLDGPQLIVVRTDTGKRLLSALTRTVKAKRESCKKRKDRDAIQWSGRGLAASVSLSSLHQKC